jgi:hypothetical protein
VIFVLVEFDVEGDEIDGSFKAVYRTINLDVPIVSLVVDILDQHADLLVDVAIIACK